MKVETCSFLTMCGTCRKNEVLIPKIKIAKKIFLIVARLTKKNAESTQLSFARHFARGPRCPQLGVLIFFLVKPLTLKQANSLAFP